MAGDWIKIEHALPDKPEVVRMADDLGLEIDAVVGKLIRFWAWCDAQSVTGNALGVTKQFLDRLTHQPGFADALIKVDWLRARSGSLEVPRFDRHNGQSAKARAESNRRVAEYRVKKRECNGNVTENALQKPLPEKRREESSTDTPTTREGADAGDHDRKPIRRPTLDQARSAAASIGVTPAKAEEWWHVRESTDWIKGTAGGGTIAVGANWQADLKTYAARVGFNGTNGNHRAEKSAREYPEPTRKALPRI